MRSATAPKIPPSHRKLKKLSSRWATSDRRGDKLVDQVGDLVGLILLQKMARVRDCHVLLPLGPWNALVEDELASFRNRVRIAERGQKRLGEPLQNFPRRLVLGDRAVFRRNRDQRRKAARTRLERFVRERRVVGGLFGFAQGAAASHAHNLPDRQDRRALAEFEPSLEPFAESLAGRQPGIGDHHARESFWKRGHQPKPDQAAPVLAEERKDRKSVV